MFYIHYRCPNCKKDHQFNVVNVGEYVALKPQHIPKYNFELLNENPYDLKRADAKAYGSATCPGCRQPVLFVFKTFRKFLEDIKKASGQKRLYTGKPVELIEAYPPQTEPYTHPALSDTINEIFSSLQRIEEQNESPSIVVGGCRSVVEKALDELGAEGKTPFRKIEDLLQKGVITKVLADWTHHIRLQGNEAIHELNATPEEAEQIVDFTKVFLEYTLVLPYKIKKLRK